MRWADRGEPLGRVGMMGGAVVPAMAPGVIALVGVLLRIGVRRGRSGPWEVLHELARGRRETAAERERRDTIVQVLELLDAGGRFDEVDEQGRHRTYEVRPSARGTTRRGEPR